MRIAVLGCGPAGLMAVHAASLFGHVTDVRIFSKARKSHMLGAQYLHDPIPMASRKPSFRIQYELRGTSSQYRDKVYGKDHKGSVSPDDLSKTHDAWDIREAYDWLWETYGGYVTDLELDSEVITNLLSDLKPDLTISTIPAPLLCLEGHRFRDKKIWSTGENESTFYVDTLPDNTVICNGEDSPRWYRAARIQGRTTVEWPHDSKPPLPGLFEVSKPLDTNCVCLPSVVRMGRYGRWQKGILSHQSFYETTDLLSHPYQTMLLP